MIICTVSWERKKNGFKPGDSVYSNIVLANKIPDLLIAFYEKFISQHQQLN